MLRNHTHVRSLLLPFTLLALLGLALPGVPGPLGASRARACSCAARTPEQAFESASAVFEGQVTGIERSKAGPDGGAPELLVTLRVVRAWKGVDHEQVTVLTAGDEAACGYRFQDGKSYLVYAPPGEPHLRVSLCSRTRPAAEAREEMDAMGVGVVPVRPALSSEEKQLFSSDARPEPRPAGCASCAIASPRSSIRGWAAGLLVALVLGIRRYKHLYCR